MSAETAASGLKCRLCGKTYPKEALNFCTEDFGPLEVTYDYDDGRADDDPGGDRGRGPGRCGATASCCRSTASRPWGEHVGGTPLVRADRLARALGVSELYIKNDAVNYPTLSFKDRVVAVALSKAVELGFQTVGCASTGNLANSVAANAAAAGLEAYVLIPDGLEQGKVLGATHLRRQGDRHRRATTTRSTASAPRSPSGSAGASSTSISGRSTPRGPSRSASRSPRTWAGGRPITSSPRWPAAA